MIANPGKDRRELGFRRMVTLMVYPLMVQRALPTK
jgi:hypothetical protein